MNRFSALIKPASSLCDMRCRYCFYCDEAARREQKSYGMMRPETARAVVDRVFACLSPRAHVNFAFQGGEPRLAGLEFFRDFVAYAEAANSSNFRLAWSIQTNGLSIDEEWAAFFAQKRFSVGLSLDASGEFHDQNRLDATGRGTFSRVMRARRALLRAGVPVNVLTVVTRQMASHPRAVFQALQKNAIDHVQLIPCLSPLDGALAQHDLRPKDYASFMKDFFTQWCMSLRTGGQRMHVRYFDNLISLARGGECEQCGAAGQCTPQFVVGRGRLRLSPAIFTRWTNFAWATYIRTAWRIRCKAKACAALRRILRPAAKCAPHAKCSPCVAAVAGATAPSISAKKAIVRSAISFCKRQASSSAFRAICTRKRARQTPARP